MSLPDHLHFLCFSFNDTLFFSSRSSFLPLSFFLVLSIHGNSVLCTVVCTLSLPCSSTIPIPIWLLLLYFLSFMATLYADGLVSVFLFSLFLLLFNIHLLSLSYLVFILQAFCSTHNMVYNIALDILRLMCSSI